MAQVWECIKCGATTQDPQEAGNHERKYNNGKLFSWSRDAIDGEIPHFMDDIGE